MCYIGSMTAKISLNSTHVQINGLIGNFVSGSADNDILSAKQLMDRDQNLYETSDYYDMLDNENFFMKDAERQDYFKLHILFNSL